MWQFEEDDVPDGSNGSNGSRSSEATEEVSTKKRCTMAKRWCFTWNNYPKEWQTYVAGASKHVDEYIIGQEVGGESHIPHLQGYLELKRKLRPIETLKWPKEVHWEIARGTRDQNVAYCSKEGKYIATANCTPPEPLKLITEFRPWQQVVVDLCQTEPDERSIYWFWEPVGNVGKSKLCKYLCAKLGAIICAGKAADMKHQIAETMKNGRAPKVVIFDIPRSNIDYISYTGIEEIKNGCFASQKYESGMVIMNCPHVICFANEMPEVAKMSADRWRIHNINDLDFTQPDEPPQC